MTKIRIHSLAALWMLTAFLTGCASSRPKSVDTTKEPATPEERVQLLQQENEVGRLMAARLIGHFGSYRKDPKLIEYVNLVGQTVASQVGRSELKYRFGILDSDELHAYAAPGGYVFVTTGLLAELKNESELAGVLAHEVAHVNERHLIEQLGLASPSAVIRREMAAVQTALKLLGKQNSAIARSIDSVVEQALETLLKKGLGRSMEREADQAALLFSAIAGYDPVGLPDLLRRIARKRPLLEDDALRVSELEAFARENGTSPQALADEGTVAQRFAVAFESLHGKTTKETQKK